MSGWGTLTGEANYTLSSLAHSNAPQLKLGAFNWRGYARSGDGQVAAGGGGRDGRRQAPGAPRRGERPRREGPAAEFPLAAVSSAWTLRKDRVKMIRTRADEDSLAMDVVPAK